MNRRIKLEGYFKEALDRKKLVPFVPWNKRTLTWLNKLGCVVGYENRRGNSCWSPEIEIKGITDHLYLNEAFSIRTDQDDGSRWPGRREHLKWIAEGTVIEIKCAIKKNSKPIRYFNPTRPKWIRVWVPKDLGDRIIVLEGIP